MGLIDDVGTGPVAIDTAAFIYFMEAHPRYLPILEPLFQAADAGRLELVTSAVTLLEVLVVPFRAGDARLAERYEALLTQSAGLECIDLSLPNLRIAAQLRAQFRVKTPDALQLAAALSRRCTALVTNDRDLPAIPTLRVIQLRDYV